MATVTLRRVSRPEILRAIAPARLLSFLKPHRRYFLSRGVDLPISTSDGEIDYDVMAKIFLTPDTKTPKELVDAIYFIDEMATPNGMDALLAEAHKRNLELPAGSEHSPADVAVQVWLLTISDEGHWCIREDAIRAVLPDQSITEEPLSERTQETLVAMLQLNAVDSDRKQPTAEIAARAMGPQADANSLKKVISDLAVRKLVETRRGRGHGCWLTEKGRLRAEKLSRLLSQNG